MATGCETGTRGSGGEGWGTESLRRRLARDEWVPKRSEEQPGAFLLRDRGCYGKGYGALERRRVRAVWGVAGNC